MAQLFLDHVSKIYPGGVHAVHDFHLTVADGEFLVLVGPSGCGKSTTLRMVAGLEDISEGRIFIGDRIVNDVLPKDRDIAMVFQNYALYPDKTVYENMAFCLRMRQTGNLLSRWRARKEYNAEIDCKIREAAEILGITPLLQRRPKELSGGQRQRVAVGRCIVRNPSVFLFDEPLSNLDAKMRVQMRTEISRLHHRLETTMLYVTHDQTEAMTMGDRIVVMKDGMIQQVASPATLYDEPANLFVAGFIGTPPMNFFQTKLIRHENTLFLECQDCFRFPVPAPWLETLAPYQEKELIFGLRPEHIGSPAAWALPDAPKVHGKVEVIEPMGAETFLYLKNNSTSFIARVEAHSSHLIAEELELPFQWNSAHIFDPASTQKIL